MPRTFWKCDLCNIIKQTLFCISDSQGVSEWGRIHRNAWRGNTRESSTCSLPLSAFHKDECSHDIVGNWHSYFGDGKLRLVRIINGYDMCGNYRFELITKLRRDQILDCSMRVRHTYHCFVWTPLPTISLPIRSDKPFRSIRDEVTVV
jgi:hypothetical protein